MRIGQRLQEQHGIAEMYRGINEIIELQRLTRARLALSKFASKWEGSSKTTKKKRRSKKTNVKSEA
jgi:hypothetical protein